MSFAKVDWSRTLAYTDGKRPEIWINLKGRQNQGIVDPADYDKVRDQIIAAIEPAVNAKTGEPLCRKVWKREEAYCGPYVERSPDLVIEWLDAGPCLDVKQADGRVFHLNKQHLPDDPFDRLLNGGHDQFGIVGLLGAGREARTDRGRRHRRHRSHRAVHPRRADPGGRRRQGARQRAQHRPRRQAR